MTAATDGPAPARLDVAALRAGVPALASGWAFFDGPGGTQTPAVVAEAVAATLLGPVSNRGRATPAQRAADDVVTGFRRAVADLLGCAADGVVLGRSATQLTVDLARTLAGTWSAGDEVVVTRLDHDANVRPWVLAARRAGAVVRWADFDPGSTELDPGVVASLLTPRTRVVALTAASNLVGTVPDVRAVADAAHAVGALVHVDAVHAAAHLPVDVEALGADTLTFSPYKLLGPHCGALVADPDLLGTLRPDKLLPSSDAVPERFELGTLPYELMAGATAAVDLVASLAGDPPEVPRRERLVRSMTALVAHEDRLRVRVEQRLGGREDVVLRSRAAHRTPTLLLTFPGHDAAAVSAGLVEHRVSAPAGHFYALEASRHLGLGDAGGLRVGTAPYTDDADVDRLLDALDAVLASGTGLTR